MLGGESPDSALVVNTRTPVAARSERHPRALSSLRRRRRILLSSSGRETDDEEDSPPAPIPIVLFASSSSSSSSSSVEARVFSPSVRGQLEIHMGTDAARGSMSVPTPTALPFSLAARQ